MKAIEIKKDLKQSGFNTKGISIRIDNAYSDTYILVTIPDEYAGNKEELTTYLRNNYISTFRNTKYKSNRFKQRWVYYSIRN